MSAGIGLAFAAMANLIVEAVPPSQTGEATGINTLTRSVGASIGSQVSAAILAGSAVAGSAIADGRRVHRRVPRERRRGRARRLHRGRDPARRAPCDPGARPRAASARWRSGDDGGEHPKRADAVRNRARVVAAAAEVFAERGIEASVPDVAERAGVGKATVYRSFPTKEHLVAAVVADHLAEFERRARAKLDEPDAWAALEDLMGDAAVRQCSDRTLSGALKAGVAPELLAAARTRMWAAVEAADGPREGAGRDAPGRHARRTCACSGSASRGCSRPTRSPRPPSGAATRRSRSARCAPDPPARGRARARRRAWRASACP